MDAGRRRPRNDEAAAADPHKKWTKYKVVAHTEQDIIAHCHREWPGSQHLATHASISYVLFDRKAMGGGPRFEDAVAICIDGIAQRSVCGGVIGDDFKQENLTTTHLAVVVVALVAVEKGRDFIGKGYCPIGFTLSTYRDGVMLHPRTGEVVKSGGMVMHLELLCAEKQKVPGEALWIQVGDVLIYHTLHHVVDTKRQDLELYALWTKPHLVTFYSKHGFMLGNKYGGCEQLTKKAVREYDDVMADYERKVPFTEIEFREVLMLLHLRYEDVFQEKQGYYMILCSGHRGRIQLSRLRAVAVLEAQNPHRNNLEALMVSKYKVIINIARRDREHDIYVETLEQMRRK